MTARHRLDRPELLPLWRAVHDRLSAGRTVSRVRIGPLDDAGREAVADLLGLDRLPGREPVIHLLRLLAAHGSSLHHHGDFDGEGIRIAAHVMDRTGAEPWRMAVRDYRAAGSRIPGGPDPGRLTPAPWDPELADAMAELRIAEVEEVVADVLLEDLDRVSAH